VVNLKEKCRNCGTIGHKTKDCKLKTNQNGGRTEEITTILKKYE
jgi:hypothetical protein